MERLLKINELMPEQWQVNFMEHSSLSFKSYEDMKKYISGEYSEEHGYMEYERVITSVEHIEYFDVCWKDG